MEFYSDFSQLKYVFAEIVTRSAVDNDTNQQSENDTSNKNPIDAKLKILEDELKIIEQSNVKFKDENEILKNQINSLNNQISTYKNEISNQKKVIDQFDVDLKELEFLRLNLEYSHKCRKSFFNNKGFIVGTQEYKNCVLNRGRLND